MEKKHGIWLLVGIVVVGLAFTGPIAAANGNETSTNETTADETSSLEGNSDEWADWMGAQMTAHMGPGATEWMESHMGLTVGEMSRSMADGERSPMDGNSDRSGMSGQGHC